MSQILDLKVFVPSKNFQLAKDFYSALGFQLNWQYDPLVKIQAWGQRVLYLWDPSGVLWHIAEPLETDAWHATVALPVIDGA